MKKMISGSPFKIDMNTFDNTIDPKPIFKSSMFDSVYGSAENATNGDFIPQKQKRSNSRLDGQISSHLKNMQKLHQKHNTSQYVFPKLEPVPKSSMIANFMP